jgi:hypothetical protein
MPTGQHDRARGTNQRRLDRIEQKARDAVTDKAVRDAKRIVAIWNGRRAKGRELWFHLRIRAAIAAGPPWLTFICPARQQIGEIDLRRFDRHPNATIESLILALSCRRCRPNPPFVMLLGQQVAEISVTNLQNVRGRRAAPCGVTYFDLGAVVLGHAMPQVR